MTMLVNSIDNIGAEDQHRSSRDRPEVPRLHRTDRGMGGIGSASEQLSSAQQYHEEDSSLAMAREFLSRAGGNLSQIKFEPPFWREPLSN